MRQPTPPRGRSLPPIKSKKKYLSRAERVELMAKIYKDCRDDYHEANTPTALFNIFEEFLEAIPLIEVKNCETLGLFAEALSDYTGEKEKKKYI